MADISNVGVIGLGVVGKRFPTPGQGGFRVAVYDVRDERFCSESRRRDGMRSARRSPAAANHYHLVSDRAQTDDVVFGARASWARSAGSRLRDRHSHWGLPRLKIATALAAHGCACWLALHRRLHRGPGAAWS